MKSFVLLTGKEHDKSGNKVKNCTKLCTDKLGMLEMPKAWTQAVIREQFDPVGTEEVDRVIGVVSTTTCLLVLSLFLLVSKHFQDGDFWVSLTSFKEVVD